RRLAILEHREDYPGVNVDQLTVREYPFVKADGTHDLAAQVLGYTGEISDAQLKQLSKDGYQPGDTIGRAGIEAAYDAAVRGAPHRETVKIDPTGKQVGAPLAVHQGSMGDDVQLSLDVNVQQAAETALEQGMESARHLQNKNVVDHYENDKAPA